MPLSGSAFGRRRKRQYNPDTITGYEEDEEIPGSTVGIHPPMRSNEELEISEHQRQQRIKHLEMYENMPPAQIQNHLQQDHGAREPDAAPFQTHRRLHS